MSSASFRVTQVGPLVSIQDGGRFGYKRFGVTASGAMDRIGFNAANRAVGNPIGATAVEVSLGDVTLECLSGNMTAALAGGGFIGQIGKARFGSWSVRDVSQGQTLSVRPGRWGNWTYIAFAGDVQSDRWLGSAATHISSGRGGGQLSVGDTIYVHNTRMLTNAARDIPCPIYARPRSVINVVLGPQDQHFEHAALRDLQNEPFRLTSAYDRMGVRLQGSRLGLNDALSIPSEPIGRGAIQVGGDGTPTVLLADHQTTGGYPKIATVISSDIDSFAQLRPNQTVRFQTVAPDRAVALARMRAKVSAP